MAMIAYLDESGTHGDGSPAVILGGFIANESAWAACESDLQALLSVHGLEHFHANKFRKRSGPFKGWAPSRQRVFVSDFFSLIDKHLAFGFAVTCKQRDYADIYKAGTVSRKVRKDSQYGLCFRLCLSAANRFVSEMQDEWPLTVVLESGHANTGDAERIFDQMKSSLPTGLLGLMILEKKRDCLRVAPADAFVHIARSACELLSGPPLLHRRRRCRLSLLA
jgi:uncharacterized protein DUF3800